MSNPKYDVDYFINKFEAIPYDRWTTGIFKDRATGAMCALGHCGVTDSNRTEESTALTALLDNKVAQINDGRSRLLQDNIAKCPTPKDRILFALKRLKS